MTDDKMMCLTVDIPEDPLIVKYQEKACKSSTPIKMLMDELYCHSSVLQYSIKSSNTFLKRQNQTVDYGDENICNNIMAIIEVLSKYVDSDYVKCTKNTSDELARYTSYYLEQEDQIKELNRQLAEKDKEIAVLSSQLENSVSAHKSFSEIIKDLLSWAFIVFPIILLLFWCAKDFLNKTFSDTNLTSVSSHSSHNSSYSDYTYKSYDYSDSSDYSNAGSGMVWIDDTAKKYHAKNSCNMDNPYQVTIEEAEAMGREPCGRCY